MLLVLVAYTVFAAGPFIWVAILSLRTTSEITANPYALPSTLHFGKFVSAWVGSNYDTYFLNSLTVVGSAVAILTLVGGAAAHCFARYTFPGRRFLYFLIFSSLIFPPQITVIALFQILVRYGLFNTLTGLTLAYVAFQLPITVYLLEAFFERIPTDLYDAARMDGYSEWELFWRITIPIGLPAISTTVIVNTILLWNEFLYAVVLITSDNKRTLPLGIMHFLGSRQEDIGMIATGLMIAVVPVILVYIFFSEKLIQGMTAGAIK